MSDTPGKILFGCTVFVVIGIYLINDGGLFAGIIGYLCLIFFGGGGLYYLFKHLRTQYLSNAAEPELRLESDPAAIDVIEVRVEDEEVLECFKRNCTDVTAPMQGISVIRTIDSSGFRSLIVDAGDVFRNEPEQSQLSDAVESVLGQLPDVDDIVREDHEVWLVSGDCSSESLVRYASVAVDRFHKYRIEHNAADAVNV